ncbi:MAG: TonB-dependent receptor, partial [Pedobacter sp.]
SVWSASHKGSYSTGKHFLQWGQSVERQNIDDKLHEWEYLDSAGYNLPYDPSGLVLNSYTSSKASINILRLSGYVQDNLMVSEDGGVSVQGGVRYNYNDLNNELLLSPRLGISWKPSSWTRDIIFRGSAGAYHQPPFYRELRRPDGSINKDLKAQRSYQVVGGVDYNFRSGNRPYRLTAEAYYKSMSRVVPYDIDNVRIRYTGNNEAKAYATGAELRLFTELVKDAESWISFGLMRTRENLDNDVYYNYTLDSSNKVVDSSLQQGGWFRRPTDRLVTFGLFLQDYLATNKNFKVYLNFLYGSNMPYNIPGSIKYRNALTIDPYIRIDIGFSALLLDADKANRRSHSPFRNFENIWATLEVFNLIDRDNTISYMLIKDFSNTRFAIPNRLTPRLLNLKVVARF